MTTLERAARRAIAAGLAYILARQARDGSWTDWALPPGPSTPWTTAYIGLKLAALPPDLGAVAAPALAAAARWLRERVFPDGGWGYNPLVGSDADSTAHALLFLAIQGIHMDIQDIQDRKSDPEHPGYPCGFSPSRAYARLASFQNEDGGFATYLPDGPRHAWNASHPDVTPVALRALVTQPAPKKGRADIDEAKTDAAIVRGIEYVLRQQTEAGLWHSYWWSSDLYSTEANLAFLAEVGVAAPPPAGLAEIEPGCAFEAALQLSALRYAGGTGMAERVEQLARRLMRAQRPDGSWDSAPVLRITRRECYEPWVAPDAGPLYADPERLFTTATVIFALGRI